MARVKVDMDTSIGDDELATRYATVVLSRFVVPSRTSSFLSALVPFDQLCPLAKDWRVRHLQRPEQLRILLPPHR